MEILRAKKLVGLQFLSLLYFCVEMNTNLRKLITMRIVLFYLLFFCFTLMNAQKNRMSTNDYIERYQTIAVDEMKRSGIPASITLAQGIIESGSGNSTLAAKANNHFGIKCHNWTGEKIYHDDDARDECFRKYNSPEDSYRDHTDFLLNTKRYSFLFEYESTDYKSWAKGLKKSGYATNPNYPDDLIRTIEENDLHRFDSGDYKRPAAINKKNSKSSDDNFVVDIKRRKIYERNRIKYIIAGKGDNIASLTKELDLYSNQLKNYNELPDDYSVKEGEVLYIQPKRWRAEVGNDFYIVKDSDNMHSISQLYGMKLKKLYRKNRMEMGTEPVVGQKLWLRKRKPAETTN